MSEPDDEDVVAVQIGRDPRGAVEVVRRCPLGLPVVTRAAPVLDDGTPFPTRYWLSCPLGRRRVSQLEAAGRIAALEARTEQDPSFAVALERTHRRYAADRDAALPAGASRVPTGGVAGARGGIKCLHAHYADWLARGDNPVGDALAAEVGTLDCETPCVTASAEGAVHRNPDWKPRE